MAEQINALLVHARDDAFYDLTRVLRSLGMKVTVAGSCSQASQLLKERGAIDLVFAGTNLRDGGWSDVLAAAQRSRAYLPVIVVSRLSDMGLYMDAVGRGAFDFVTPPFLVSDLAHIARSAIYKELVSVQHDLVAPRAA